MKIDSSNLQMSSQHSAVEKRSVRESLKMWIGDQRPDFEGNASRRNSPAPDVSVNISQQAQAAAQADPVQSPDPGQALENDPRYQLIILMVEAMTGRKIRLVKMEDVQPDAPPAQNAPTQAQRPAGFGIEYDYHETRYEAEQTRFSAEGVVRTADGREIRFNLELAMSREHTEQTDISLRVGDAVRKKDPLVINFSGNAAQLSDAKFDFDLDNDGQTEQISFVGSGSGFLALDKNSDGKINNGSELFGPATGNGFTELAAYDQDRNGWIDENDAIYQQLRVWTRDSAGKDSLGTLAAMKVGAISLANIGTPFDLKDSRNQLDGQVRSTGIYLKEDGGAGTVQQVDLAV
jgi:hypothetical protein